MGSKIRVVFASMERMAGTFDQSRERLQDSIGVMLKLADQLETSALKGDAGSEAANQLRSTLVPAMSKFADKMGELKDDVIAAMNLQKDEDNNTKGFMGR